MTKMPYLPTEIVLQIIADLIPPKSNEIFPPSHLITRTLVSLTLTSKLTRLCAQQLLLDHCLYIDSSQRLEAFLDGYQKSISTHNTDEQWRKKPKLLFLAPFPSDSLEQPQTVRRVDELSLSLSDNLERLVIDMPLRRLYPDEDHQGLRKLLRKAFLRLTALEEFCSVRDELYLETVGRRTDPEVWPAWPRLRRLALYNISIDVHFSLALQLCSNLTHLVLTRADGLFEHLPVWPVKYLPWGHLKRVVIVNTDLGHERERSARRVSWATADSFLVRLLLMQRYRLDGSINSKSVGPVVDFITVPEPPGRGDDDIELCQDWVCSRALDGTLWELPGDSTQAEAYKSHCWELNTISADDESDAEALGVL